MIESMDPQGQFYVLEGDHTQHGKTLYNVRKIYANHQTVKGLRLENVTIPSYIAKTNAGLFVHQNRLYILTGQSDDGCGQATRAAAYLDMSNHSWMRLPDVPEARYAPTTVVVDNCIHLFAGTKPDRTTPAHNYWILDLNHLTRGWINASTVPFSGNHGRASLIDDWIYFYGFEHVNTSLETTYTSVRNRKKKIACPDSYNAQPQVMKIHSKYVVKSSEWIRLPDMPRPVTRAASLVLDNRWIVVIGGVSHEVDQYDHNIQLFDTITDQWRLLSSVPHRPRSSLVWIGKDQSVLHMQTQSSHGRDQTHHANIIWSQQRHTEKCLFYTDLNCTTRKLARSPLMSYRRLTEMKWNKILSNIYLMNMPIAVERLRRVWNELDRIDLTSITMLETFQIQNLTNGPVLLREDLIWPLRMQELKKANDTRTISHIIRSKTSLKVMFMNLWNRDLTKGLILKPILILEDDVHFLLSKDETFRVLFTTVTYLQTHSHIEWDLLYLDYRNIEATRTFQISKDAGIHLWRASSVLSGTAFIVNKHPETVARLNKCSFEVLNEADQAINACLKFGLIRAFLIEPKLAEAIPGFSYNMNRYEDYRGKNHYIHTLGNHTPPAKFNVVGKMN